jgi:glutathione synthase
MPLRYLARGGYTFKNGFVLNSSDLPENTSTKSLALGIRTAFENYCKLGTKHNCCVLFLVQDPERNIFDQRHLEYELETVDPMIPVFRLPFASILANTSIADTATRELLYHPPHSPTTTYEAAVVYFRAGYGPQDYPDSSAWQARLHIERSRAIKCPSVLTQLAGAKKVQQVLATPSLSPSSSILSRFLGSDHPFTTRLEKTFTNIFPLDLSQIGLSARKIALDPELCKGYVLKPQREGGGNNIYRSAIPPLLKSLPESHWKSYILMEIITPPPVHNMILRNGNVEKGGVISELGIYGTCLWNHESKEVLFNQTAGYLLRTKGEKSEEGGVAAGFGAMDSCLLV